MHDSTRILITYPVKFIFEQDTLTKVVKERKLEQHLNLSCLTY